MKRSEAFRNSFDFVKLNMLRSEICIKELCERVGNRERGLQSQQRETKKERYWGEKMRCGVGARCLGKLYEGRGGKSGLVLAEVPSVLRTVTPGVSLSDRHFLARWRKSCVHAPW